MPRGGDPNCPLGFHPQFRRPNYCKRCFREYNEHKTKDLSGSTTSINSLTSYDPNTNSFTRIRDDSDTGSLYGSRDSLASSSRQKEDAESGTKSVGKGGTSGLLATKAYSTDDKTTTKIEEKSWATSKTLGTSWGKSHPMSWSAQDLRQAVNDAKEITAAYREDLSRTFGGSAKSLDQDGVDTKTTSSISNAYDNKAPPKGYSSFSSYLAMRTKSPARPPLSKSSSLQTTSSGSTDEITKIKEPTRNGVLHKEQLAEDESKISRLNSSEPTRGTKSILTSSDSRPPRAPVRIKERSLSAKLPDLKETPEKTTTKPKTILSLKNIGQHGEENFGTSEVKSEDDGVDASYVIRIAKPKPKKVEIDLDSEIERLHKENKDLDKELQQLTEKYNQIEAENREMSKKPKFGDVRKQTEISKLQQKIDDINDDNKSKQKEVKELKKEIEKRPLPKDVEKTLTDLRSKLRAAEQLCEELMDESEDYKREIRSMEEEIEEMQDNFREDQADEYRDLKRELEQRAKDCRVMQFKLKKSERRSDTLERDKSEAEEKLRELQLGDGDIDRAERIKYMEKELNLAKEVSLKMHEEMEKMVKDLEKAEVDKRKLKEKVADSPSKTIGGRYSRSSMMGRQGSQDNTEQLLRDLQATQEREQDIKEQLRFSEEEGKGMRKKVSRLEEENETLQLQLNKMSAKAKASRQRSLERSGSLERQSSVERGTLSRQSSTEKPPPTVEDIDPTELKIQLELIEQESAVIRRKLELSESENERLQKEIKEVLSYKETKKTASLGPAPETTRDNLYFDKKIKMLEEESSRLRKKIIDSETERDQLQADLDLSKKRAKISRSRSMEQAELDLRKKIDTLEGEVSSLRSSSSILQTDNDNFADEVKRLQLKTVRRLPLSPQENIYVENQILQDKILRAEKRFKESTQKLKNVESSSAGVSVIDKDLEITELKEKINELQQGSSVETKKLTVTTTPTIIRTPKVPKDTTPKTTLIKWVTDLEGECSDLHNKFMLLGIEKQTLEKVYSEDRRNSKNTIDGDMCNILIADTNKLKGDLGVLGQKLALREIEARKLKKQLKDAELEVRDNQDKMTKYKNEEERIQKLSTTGERANFLPTELTSKSTLRRFVDELNKECARLQVALKENEKKKRNVPEETISHRDMQDKLQREHELVQELGQQLKEEREKADKNVSMERRLSQRAEEARRHEERVQGLRRELDDEKESSADLREQLVAAQGVRVGFDELRAAQTEKHKSQKELEEEKINLTATEERHKEMTMSWLREREDLKKDITAFRKNKENAEDELRVAQKNLENNEVKLVKEQRKISESKDAQKKDSDSIRRLNITNENLLIDLDEVKDTVARLEREKTRIGSKVNKETEVLRAEKGDLEIRMATMESEIKAERLKRDRLEKEATTRSFTSRTHVGELAEVNRKLTKTEHEVKKLNFALEEVKATYDQSNEELNKKIKKERDELINLQSKYELLEEDFVVQKAQFITKKEGETDVYDKLRKEYSTIETELKKLRETYNLRQDTWIKEKLTMQEQVKEMENRLGKPAVDSTSFMEKTRLMDILEDKNHQIEKLRRDEEALRDQFNYFRKESEDQRRRLEDMERLNEFNERRHPTTKVNTSELDHTIKELRARLSVSEKALKNETMKIKLKYDTKLKSLSEEMSLLSSHMSKYRRERDSYREMLEAAQRNVTDLKSGSVAVTPYRTSRADTANELANYQQQMQDLHSTNAELEDKVADARLENSRLKNDLIDVKTNADIQLCETQTKLNEYEEDRLLGGGSRKVPGLRTRLELNWQKEREEQQRLLQETATLAKDLRQTLYELERERDLEKLESKRKIEQLKRSVNMDHQDTIGKVKELQRDLQELREAHAKLRQINEKLRREKDRTEVEREAMRGKFLGSSRESLNQQSKMERIVDEMRRVRDLAPLILGESIDGQNSSLTNLSGEVKLKTKEDFTESLKRLVRGMDDLKGLMGIGPYDEHHRDRLRRATSLRRALSIESDDEGSTTGSLRAPRSVGRSAGLHRLAKPHKTSLYRKAQSLDHQMAEDRGKIWVSTDAGSTSSIESGLTEEMRKAKYERDISLDRISTGSQTSEVEGEKKRKGIKGMLSMLSKARSIEDTSTGGSIVGVGVKAMIPSVGTSGTDLPTEVEKDTVKSKIKTLFNKKSSFVRSQSGDREVGHVRRATAALESDTASVASNTSVDSMANIPPVLRRLQGRNPFLSVGQRVASLTNLSSLSRQSSYETQV